MPPTICVPATEWGCDTSRRDRERREAGAGPRGGSQADAAPAPEVVAKPMRRQFTAEYRLRILEEVDFGR